MPPTPLGYPFHPTPQPYNWQPPVAYPGTPHGFDAHKNQAIWPVVAPTEQSIEPDQDWRDENDNESHMHREFDVVEVERKVLPPPPKSLPVKPQPLAANAHRDDPISLEKSDAIRTASPKTTTAPLGLKVNNSQGNMETLKFTRSENATKHSELHQDGIVPVKPHKQQAPIILDLEAMDFVKAPQMLKSENTFRTSELHQDGIVPSVKPYKQQASLTLDLEAIDFIKSPKMLKSELDPHRLAESVDAYARNKLPSQAPLKPRRSPQDTFTTQTKIPKSWHQRSNNQQSHPAKRPVSTSFGTVQTTKKPKSIKGKPKPSQPTRSGVRWTASDYQIAQDAMKMGQSWNDIADLLGRTADTVKDRMSLVRKLWVPRKSDLELMRRLVVDQKIESYRAIARHFTGRGHGKHLGQLFRKIQRGYPLTIIPTEPDDFLTRIQHISKGEKFDQKYHRGVVYPQDSLEPFEYRWIDGQLLIIDTANLLINANPLLAWYPSINKLQFIKPICYAVVSKKTSQWFAGEWISILLGVRLYMLSGHWTDKLEDLVLFDNNGNRRQTHEDIVDPFKDDNGEMMCSLCDLAFTSQDSYLLHAGLHEQGWVHIRPCCLDIATYTQPFYKKGHRCLPHQKANIRPVKEIVDRHVHGSFHNLIDFQGTLNQDDKIDHNWDLVAYSVRWSGADGREAIAFNEEIELLVELYEDSYQPTSREVIKSPCLTRSSRRPIFVHSNKASRQSQLFTFFKQIHDKERSSRILIMSQSIEGLTTNLQSLVYFARWMEHLHVTLGFCLVQPSKLLDFGQEVKNDKAWVFYNLQTLRENITGAATDPKYMRLVTALFVIQKYKEE